MKAWTRQRANRRKKHYEKRNAYGNKDLTIFNAGEQIRTHGKAKIEL